MESSLSSNTHNPVISVNSSQFRDPKVIWFEDHWVMAVSYAQDYVIGIYTSPDLKSWTHASNFSHHGLLGLQYEWPNLISMPMEGANTSMYLMIISINPGAPLGGSIMQYFPGSFNGTHFEAVGGAARLTDFGKDGYAGRFFYVVHNTEDQVFIAWSSNWQYSQLVPTGPLEAWRSSMSLPRRTRLANVTRIGYDLISNLYDLSTVYSCELVSNSSFGNGTLSIDYSSIPSGALYFKFNVSSIPTDGTAQGTLNFTFSASSTNKSLSGAYFLSGDALFWLNRRNTKGFDNLFFTDKFSYNKLIATSGIFLLEGVLERSILEIFLDGGEASATTTFFPEGSLDTMLIATSGLNDTVIVQFEAWALESAWADLASSGGIV
jgi:beta-fructofuranosidase